MRRQKPIAARNFAVPYHGAATDKRLSLGGSNGVLQSPASRLAPATGFGLRARLHPNPRTRLQRKRLSPHRNRKPPIKLGYLPTPMAPAPANCRVHASWHRPGLHRSTPLGESMAIPFQVIYVDPHSEPHPGEPDGDAAHQTDKVDG